MCDFLMNWIANLYSFVIYQTAFLVQVMSVVRERGERSLNLYIAAELLQLQLLSFPSFFFTFFRGGEIEYCEKKKKTIESGVVLCVLMKRAVRRGGDSFSLV